MISRPLKTCLVGLLTVGAVATVQGQTEALCVPPPAATFQSISRAEMESMLADVAVSNPMVLDRFREDPESKTAQIDNLRELLAIAYTAVKEGHAAKPNNCRELEYTRDELIATQYDKEKNKGKGKQPPFGFITDASVAAYWRGTAVNPLSSTVREDREAGFQKFLEGKLGLLAAENPAMKDRAVSDAEIEQARGFYAKVQISADEYKARSAALPTAFKEKAQLQVKLQQAQFLARRYAEVIASKVTASDAEIERFIAADPALSSASKRTKAEQIFARAKKGEDFAALANEFSEDPGNGSESEGKHGGMYRSVRKGQMIPAFETAALASEPGQVYPALVETEYGFHIVKLEKKDADDTYDVRHILISTTVKDPENPDGRELPIKSYARTTVEEAKQKKLIESFVAEGRITVAEDFLVPTAAMAKAPVKRVAKPAKKPVARRTVRKRS